jgi:ATP-dependent DNA ligase
LDNAGARHRDTVLPGHCWWAYIAPIPRILPAGFVASCQPSPVKAPPASGDWLHIKHDGYRLMVQRAGVRVRLFTRNGHDWAARYSAIVTAAAALQARSFLIDGEAVIADARGVASFNLLRGRAREQPAFLWAFGPAITAS